jgi:hypothetical protein
MAVFGVDRAVQPSLGRDVLCLAGCGAGLLVVDVAGAATVVVVIAVVVVVVVVIVMAVVVACWEMGFRLPLVGEELVDEAFCLAAAGRRCPAEVRRDGIVGHQRALAAVGV